MTIEPCEVCMGTKSVDGKVCAECMGRGFQIMSMFLPGRPAPGGEEAASPKTLSTGKKVGYDLLSVDADGALFGGYDSLVEYSAADRKMFADDGLADDYPERFTAEERREIAGLMIARWRAWAGIPDTDPVYLFSTNSLPGGY